MKTPVLMTMFNQCDAQLALSKLALDSVLAQDSPVEIHVINNGSTPPTREWLAQQYGVWAIHYDHNQSPVRVANTFLHWAFDECQHPAVLLVPNDVILPPNLLREMLRWPRGIVTASPTSERDFPAFATSQAVSENTPMSAMLLRRWVWDAIMQRDGHFFDESYFHFASDCDLALRIASCGIRGIQLDMQYYHYSSASHRLLDADAASRACQQADRDRATFRAKWGFAVTDLEYGQRAQDINFKGEFSCASSK